MIGVFDSGLGGLTVLRALTERFPKHAFTYLGDHRNMPYGERPSQEIIALTRAGVTHLFKHDCRLVLLGCNTATAIAGRALQQNWLPASEWAGTHNILGIVAPTVEAATQTSWAVTEPQYPQKYNSGTIVVFGTTRTMTSNVYAEEINKRCPKINVIQIACPGLAAAIENDNAQTGIDACVKAACKQCQDQVGQAGPDYVILGCTHYPLVRNVFERYLPPRTRILSQPNTVADSLEDYLNRHPGYTQGLKNEAPVLRVLTTGDTRTVSLAANRFWPEGIAFEHTDIA